MTKEKISGPYSVSDIMRMENKTDYAALDAMTDDDIDYSDIPPLDEHFWNNVQLLRPVEKEMISMRVDKDTLQWFREQGRGYQGYMNAVLRSFVETQKHSTLK